MEGNEVSVETKTTQEIKPEELPPPLPSNSTHPPLPLMSFSSTKHNVKNNYRLIAFRLCHITTEKGRWLSSSGPRANGVPLRYAHTVRHKAASLLITAEICMFFPPVCATSKGKERLLTRKKKTNFVCFFAPSPRNLLPELLLTFRRRIKSRLPFAGIIRSSPYSTRFQDKG